MWRKGKPLEAKLGDATGEHLIVIVNHEQAALPRQEIERLDWRPAGRAPAQP